MIDGAWSWEDLTINLDTKVLLDVDPDGTHGTDPATVCLRRPCEDQDPSEAVALVNGVGYSTTAA